MSEPRTLDALSGAEPAAPAPALRLAPLQARVQQVIATSDDIERLGPAMCDALCGWPGVLHAALLRFEKDDLRLDAQCGVRDLDLARLLQRETQMQLSPLGSFPALAAAAGGIAVRFDAAPGGDSTLARALRDHAVDGALGVPLRGTENGSGRGALSLMFEAGSALAEAGDEELQALAQLVSIGLRMSDLCRETARLRARATEAATVDALTGVANRRHGEELLEQEVRRARRYSMPLALLTFDIDRFKEVNDAFGHPVGDMALRTVAGAAHAMLRSSDVLVRSGGQEFQVIVPHTSAQDGAKLAEKLRFQIEQTAIPGCDQLTVSFGVAQLEGQESGDALAVRANVALARAKRAGRNRVEMARL